MEENADKLKLQRLSGGSITKFAPIFSHDANFLFVIIDKSVEVFSTSTGQSIRFLREAKSPLISLEFDLLNEKILVGCTESGEVVRWEWSTGTIQSRTKLKVQGSFHYQTFNILNLFAEGTDSPCAFVTGVKQGNPVQCFLVNTINGAVIKCGLDLKMKRQRAIVDVEKKHFNHLVIAQGTFLFFVDYKKWVWKKFSNSNNSVITCVKIHPTEELVATGDELGRIILWRQFFDSKKDVRMAVYHFDTMNNGVARREVKFNSEFIAVYHWHHTRVTSVAFTQSGSGFYSSGLEAVLVKWNIKGGIDGKEFVPRMSSIILHIATSQDNSNVAVATADNGIQILGVDFMTTCTLQEFSYTFNDRTERESFPAGLRVNPAKNTLVLNGRSGHLQFFSAYTKRMLYNVEVVEQNQLSMETDKILYNTLVTHVAFNIDWMATAEKYDDEQNLPEIRLKFWSYNKKAQNYVLNTCVDLPHENGIKAIEFSNPYHVDNLLCATAGADNKIKIWSLEASNNIYNKNSIWYCIARTDYKNKPIESIGFSQDGSLLAAGFANMLCVYKAENLKLLTALNSGGSFDGCLHKVQMRVPKVNQNGSKNDSNGRKQKVVQLFSNLLHTNDDATLLREFKKSVISKKVQEIQHIDHPQKQLLYKKIRSMNQLSLFQKLLLYQKLGISFQLSEKWHAKMVKYVSENITNNGKIKELNKEIHRLNLKSRFKAKYMLNKFVKRKQSLDGNVASKLTPLLSMLLKENVPPKPALTNGVGGAHDEEELKNSKNIVPPMQSVVQIKKVLFCYGDFAHLVIACTENRVLIWNLLTLRLQTALKLSTEQIAIDSQTNLVSVFTKNQELYIFSPSDSLTLYYRSNLPKVYGAVWLPKENPKSQTVHVNWQSRSTLYFLVNNEIMYLATEDEVEEPKLTFAKKPKSLVQYTTFGTYATNQVNNARRGKASSREFAIGVHGRAAVKSFLEMSTHTMAPLSLLCNDFLKSVCQLNNPTTDKKKKSKQTTTNGFNGLDEQSDNEDDYSSKRVLLEHTKPTTKPTVLNQHTLSEEYLQKVASETIEIQF